MSFSNQNYIYDHLPSRFRREDRDLFLKRYLQFAGETLDGWDTGFDTFWGSIDPDTASETWIDFWLLQMFGWSWFPWWFTTQEKRTLYANFGRHLGRRGTRRGIELWLLDFGIAARVHTRAIPWGELVWGEPHFAITEPLHLIVEILFLKAAEADVHAWAEGPWGEGYYTEPRPLFEDADIRRLIRYVQPHAQEIVIVWRTGAPIEHVPGGEWPLYGEPLYGE
jgi:phage tail-like protein